MKLNKLQKEAVIENLLSRFLLITFTDAAAKEMRGRLAGAFRAEGFDVDPEAIPAMTFNALDMDLIARFHEELGYAKVPTVVDVNPTAESRKVLPLITGKNRIPDVNYRIPVEFYAGKKGGMGALPLSITVFNIIREHNLDPDDEDSVDELAKYCANEGLMTKKLTLNSVKALLGKYEEFSDLLKREGLITFADQEPLGLKCLELHPDYLKSLGIYHVVVDEFQDSNDANMAFVRKLADCMEAYGGTIRSIMCIGDDAQSIYGFRKAVVENMTDFDKKIQSPGAPLRTVTHLNMTENYRSYSEIVDPANELIKLNAERVDKPLHAAKGSGGEYLVQGFYNAETETDWIIQKVKALIASGYAPNEIAIIGRTKKPLLAMQSALTKADVPATLLCPTKVMDDSRVQAAIAITGAFFDPEAKEPYKQYVNAYCEENFGKSLTEMYPKGDEDPDYLEAVDTLQKKFRNAADTRPALVLKNFHELLEGINNGEIYSRFLDMIYDEEKKAVRAAEADPDNEDDNATVKLQAAIQFIADFKRFGKDTEMKLEESYEGVAVTTAHSAKGLEWKVCFVMLSEFDNAFLHSSRCDRAEVEETRRLLFVSMTRAMEKLFVTGRYTCYITKDDDRVTNQFLKELYSISRDEADWVPIDPEEAVRKAAAKKARAEAARQKRLAKGGKKPSGNGGQIRGQMSLFI
jgi:DNA helicase-2/ATP-dependent DNA helicase PcrA